MPEHHNRYVIDLVRDDGTPLNQVPVTPDWEPLREWTQFLGVRRGVLPPLMTGAPFQVRPLWQPQHGAPYISGCQIDVTGSNGQTIASQVSTAYFRALAQHAASSLVEKHVLQPGEPFRYVVSAFPQPQQTRTRSTETTIALTVEEVTQPLPLHEMPIAHLAAQAQLYGQSHTEDYPVFITAQILDDVMALKDQAGAAETGGILIGRLHRDQTLNDIVAEVTAQIPARYTQASDAHLTFTAETWTDVQTALTLRRQDEIMLGWWHTHPVRSWCKCPRERQRHCPLAGEFFSADDGILHRTIFPRAYSLGLVLSDVPSVTTTWTTSWALFGWRHGLIEGRGFSLLGTPRQAATVTTQPRKKEHEPMPLKRNQSSEAFDPDFLLLTGEQAPSLEEKYQFVQKIRALSAECSSQLDHFLLETVTRQRQGLLEVQAVQAQCQALLETFSRPPWYPAVYLGPVMTDDSTHGLVLYNGTRRLVNVAKDLKKDDLVVGDEVFLSQDLNVLMARSPYGVPRGGETAVVERRLGDGRLLLKWRDDEVVVDVAGAVEREAILQGDRVRWDRNMWMAFEKLDHVPGRQVLLAEVPTLDPACIGGQEGPLDTLLSTLTTTLVNPDKAKAYGLSGRHSLLMIGPPGCGKTLMARVAASELTRLSGQRCLFGVVKPAEWESPYVGETQQNIRQCFHALREAARDGLVVLFLDEIEAIGRIRGSAVGHHTDKFLAALLAELDGFTDRTRVAIIAATNRKDLVDPALLERLSDVEIVVPRPDRRAARAIFSIHLATSLPYCPNGTAATDTRRAVIESAVSRFYSPNADNALCTLRFRDGKVRTVTARELLSGRIIAQVCRTAQQSAFLRDIRGGSAGLQIYDMENAVAEALAKLATTLTVRNVHAYLADLPQDLDVVSVEPIARTVTRPQHYYNVVEPLMEQQQ